MSFSGMRTNPFMFYICSIPSIANKHLQVETMREIICDILAPKEIDQSEEDRRNFFAAFPVKDRQKKVS